MKFSNIHHDIHFCCIDARAVENTNDTFARAMDGELVELGEFISYWEGGRRPIGLTKDNYDEFRKKICSFKAVSTNLYTNDEEVRKKYSDLFVKKFKPQKKRKNYFCIFKMKRGAGKIKIGRGYRPKHCDLFKSDDFSIEHLVILSVKAI